MLNDDFIPRKKISNQPPIRIEQLSHNHQLKDHASGNLAMKFPVTPDQRKELLRRAGRAKNETKSNTSIVIAALQQFKQDPSLFPPLHYENTGQYMQIKAPQHIIDEIELLYIQLNEGSRRKMLYRLIMNFIGKGEGIQK